MFLISQNIESYDVQLPDDAVFRINLAWCNSLQELENKLQKNKKKKFLIDLPIGRIKPPNNKYSLDGLLPIINEKENIHYFAISNVESKDDLKPFLEKLPPRALRERFVRLKLECPSTQFSSASFLVPVVLFLS